MAAALFADALDRLESTLAEVESTLEFIRAATSLRPRLNDLVRWEVLDGGQKQLVQQFINLKFFQPDIAYRSLHVSLYGALEEFIRTVLRDGAAAIDAKITKYEDLPEEIALQNVRRTGQALATIYDPPEHVRIDYQVLCRNIGSCLEGADSFVLNPDAFSLFFSNISSQKLTEILRRLGIRLDWDDIGRQDAVQGHFGENRTRPTAEAVQQSLNDITKTRNWNAHNGSAGVVVSDTDIGDTIGFLRVFSAALADVVSAKLSQIPQSRQR